MLVGYDSPAGIVDHNMYIVACGKEIFGDGERHVVGIIYGLVNIDREKPKERVNPTWWRKATNRED